METMELKLHSPAGSEPMVFTWRPDSPGGHDIATDIVETIRLVCDDLPELKLPLQINILRDYDSESYESMKLLCGKFNRAIDSVVKLERGTSLPAQRLNKYPSRGLLSHILKQTYKAAVDDPRKLNQYEPFSPDVYGETSFDLVCQMIELIKVKPEDIFIDLGSGVGQVVLQMAASTPCKMSIGIERAATASRYAEGMNKHFRTWMRWYGKKCGDYKLLKGDFLDDQHKEKITRASIVFVNNFAFGPAVDHKLKELFAELQDGVRIISSKSFCPLNFRISERNLSDIGTIMHVSKMPPLNKSVSWTDKPFSYYLHVIDRTKLENYFKDLKNSETKVVEDASNNAEQLAFSTDSLSDSQDSDYVPSSRSKRTENSQLEKYNNNKQPSRFDKSTEIKPSSHSKQDFTLLEDQHPEIKSRSEHERLQANFAGQVLSDSTESASEDDNTPSTRVVHIDFSSTNIQGIQLGSGTNVSTANAKHPKKIFSQPHIKPSHHTTRRVVSKKRVKKNVLHFLNKKALSASSPIGVREQRPAIPESREEPSGLQPLLNGFKEQYLEMIHQMQNPAYMSFIQKLIDEERVRNGKLKNRAAQLEAEIQTLQFDGTALLKNRMQELGINGDSPKHLVSFARNMLNQRKELIEKTSNLNMEISNLERENQIILEQNASKERILKDISVVYAYNKKLDEDVKKLTFRIDALERTIAEKEKNIEEQLSIIGASRSISHENVRSTLSEVSNTKENVRITSSNRFERQ